MKRDPLVLGHNYILPGDDIGVTRPNSNVIVVGSTGCGKTTSTLIPSIARSEYSNPVLTYAKPIEGYRMANFLKRKGYAVHVLNIAQPSQSTVSFDPLSSIESFEDVDGLSAAVVDATIKYTVDDYWRAKARPLLSALIAATMMVPNKKRDPGMIDVLELFDKLIPIEVGNSSGTLLNDFFAKLEKADCSCYAVREYNSWRSLPIKTASCVRDTLASVLSTVFPESIRRMMKDKEQLNIEDFANKKAALVVITSALDTSQQYYANLFYRDLTRRLLRYAFTCPNGELPREIRFFYDDFACSCPIIGFAHDISLYRSAGMSAVMLVQSEQQLDAIYKDEAPIIRQNCAVYAYFAGGFDDRSCELVSKRMGVPYDEILYASLGKVFIMQSGRRPVHIQRYDTLNSKEYKEYMESNKTPAVIENQH